MGYIERYWNEEEQTYKDGDLYLCASFLGAEYRDDIEDVLCHVFNFCGCGMPQEAFKYILGAIQRIHDVKEDGFSEESNDRLRNYFQSDGEAYTLYYMLDNLEITEHGASVPGWLTEKGELILEDLVKYLED